jgi:hypothetical protein
MKQMVNCFVKLIKINNRSFWTINPGNARIFWSTLKISETMGSFWPLVYLPMFLHYDIWGHWRSK